MSDAFAVPEFDIKHFKIQIKQGAYTPWQDSQSVYDHNLTETEVNQRLIDNKHFWRGWGYKFRVKPESYGHRTVTR